MSVVHFGPHELANLCAACAAKTGRPVQDFFPAAARYSQDNDACYCFTYAHHGEEPEPVTAEDLQASLPSQADFERARLTARLLRYNLVANSGRDFADKGSLEACAKLCEAVGEEKQAAKARADLKPGECCKAPQLYEGLCQNCGASAG
ncbi:MAG: hypothetical protein GWN58_32940 [Anaerolineae bacterium]|nr:hypothetical protein [Anaerolineae bacterium]